MGRSSQAMFDEKIREKKKLLKPKIRIRMNKIPSGISTCISLLDYTEKPTNTIQCQIDVDQLSNISQRHS